MNHLIHRETMGHIENQLLLRRDQLVQATSWTFNLVMFLLIIGGFVSFLYVQYTSDHPQETDEKRIPFTPTTWYSATRNVRSEEYGRQLQPFETETRHGIPGPLDGGGAEAFL